jgi:hypothetical protein
MNEKGRSVEINGKPYRMVYTSAAMLEVMDRFGDVEGMAETMQANPKEAAKIVPWLVSLLCNQGIMLDTGNTKPTNPDLLTPELFGLWTMPKEWKPLMDVAMEAIAIGSGTYHEAQTGPVDVTLQEIEREKNAEAGGE